MLLLMMAAAAFQSGRMSFPPPPPAIYDPQSGPFIVRLDEQDRVGDGQSGVIANAVRNWSGTSLQAFSICFHSAQHPVDRHAALKALNVVATELKVNQAKVVVSPNGSLCDPALARPIIPGSYVEITGLILL